MCLAYKQHVMCVAKLLVIDSHVFVLTRQLNSFFLICFCLVHTTLGQNKLST